MRAAMEKQRAAVAIQRAAVRRQAETMGVWLPPSTNDPAAVASAPAAAPPPCEPIADAVVAPLIDSAAKAHEVQPKLLRAVIEQESALRPCAVSVKGAQGLMQLMPSTAEQFGVHDPFDPKENIEAGAKYLKQLLDKYKGDIAQALGAYNSGPATVDQAGGIPDIRETRDYVDAILQKIK
ncbi:MAG: lytic transglycosylase domain-containing protein [Acidobacteriia bacterium]|nr:lytic transglycosylase domain-containing protein [Terriglobia bacterium]